MKNLPLCTATLLPAKKGNIIVFLEVVLNFLLLESSKSNSFMNGPFQTERFAIIFSILNDVVFLMPFFDHERLYLKG